MRVAIKNLDPIGSVILTFIGYQQTEKQTDKQSINIEGGDRYIAIYFKFIKRHITVGLLQTFSYKYQNYMD